MQLPQTQDVRKFIVECLIKNSEVTSIQLLDLLKEKFGRVQNPNTLNFHLTRLREKGIIEVKNGKIVLGEL